MRERQDQTHRAAPFVKNDELGIAEPGRGGRAKAARAANAGGDEPKEEAGRAALRRALPLLCPTASIATRRLLVERGHVRRFERDDQLLRARDPSPVLLVLDGYAAVLTEDSEGHGFTLQILKPGDFTGLRSISQEALSPVTIVALTAGEVAIWPGLSVRPLAFGDAGFAVGLLGHAVDEIRALQRRVEQMTIEQARERFAEALLAYEPLICRTDPAISRAGLASIMGVTREMLGVVIRDLEKRLIIRREDAVIEIVDRPGLTALLRHEIDPEGPSYGDLEMAGS